jgi:broad specificity phosphatase PhoE
MKTVYFVRHGEAENNLWLRLSAEERASLMYLGASAQLTDLGRLQAESIAQRVSSLTVDHIISSTMMRTRQTAEIIRTRSNISYEESDLFVERRSPTSLIGRRWEDPDTQERERAWISTFYAAGERFEDGENFDDLNMRAKLALAHLENRSEQRILVVTHGYYLHMLVARMMFSDAVTPKIFERLAMTMRTSNTGLTVARYDTQYPETPWNLIVWNDHAHLG